MPVLQAEPSLPLPLLQLFHGTRAVLVEPGALAAPGQGVTAKFIVEPHQPWGLQVVVDLVPADVVIGQEAAAELKAVVDAALAVHPGLQFELEVGQVASFPNQSTG